jgi:integrase
MSTFNDAYLKSLSAREQRYSVWDPSLPTFGLRVAKGGAKTFVLKRKNAYITLGRFPTPLSLSQARTEAKRLLAEFTLGRLRPQSLSYAEAVRVYLEEKGKARRSRTVSDYKRLLHRVGLSGQLGDITDAEVSRCLSRVKAEGEYNHMLVALRVLFNWCIKRRWITHNPTVGLSTHATKSRSRILTDDELKLIWNACEQTMAAYEARLKSTIHQSSNPTDDPGDDHPSLPAHFARIVQLLIVTGQRRGEIAALDFPWIDENEKTITIPASIAKNRREHCFPIGPLAASLVPKKDGNSGLVFAARGKPHTPFNGWSKSKVALDKITGVKDWTLHDLRRTYRSNLGRLGVPPHIAERLVNHVSAQSDMERTYDRYRYQKEMREAAERYENHILQLTGG